MIVQNANKPLRWQDQKGAIAAFIASWFMDPSLSPLFYTHIFTCFESITNNKFDFYQSSSFINLLFYPYTISHNSQSQSVSILQKINADAFDITIQKYDNIIYQCIARNFAQSDGYRYTYFHLLPQDIIILIMQYSLFFNHNRESKVESSFRIIYYYFSKIDIYYKYLTSPTYHCSHSKNIYLFNFCIKYYSFYFTNIKIFINIC